MISTVLLFLFLGLIVFGPKKTIELTQTVARLLAKVKHATGQLQSQLHEEVRTKTEGLTRSGEDRF